MTIWGFKTDKSQLVVDHLKSLGYEAKRVPINATWDYVMTDAPNDLLDKGLPVTISKGKETNHESKD